MNNDLCSIGMLSENGVRTIRCAWNGDVMHNGSILLNCWDTPLAATILVYMGDLVFLGPNLQSSLVAFRDYNVEWGRCAPRFYADLHQWRRQEHYCGCTCFYLFDKTDEQWHIYDAMGRERPGILEYKV